MKSLLVYIGTYTVGSQSEGIYPFCFDLNSGSLTPCGDTVLLPNPSFLTSDTDTLIAVSEVAELNGTDGGSVNAYRIDKETGILTYINTQSTQGAYPCHVALNKSEKQVVISNYMGGSIVVYPITENGSIGASTDLMQHYGCSKGNVERQEGPHAHSVTFTPDNKYALAADLGKDMVLSYTIDSEGKLMYHKNGTVKTGQGEGPRHMEFHPNGRYMYLLNELGNTIQSYQYNAENGSLKLTQTISSLPENYCGESIAADIHVHPNGKFLYASNRGHNSLIICAIDQENGALELVAHQTTLGQHPRNFSIDPTGNYLLVANKDSNSIVTFKIQKEKGLLISLDQVIEVPQPVCIHFIGSTNNN